MIKRVTQELLLLSCYMVLLKALGWLTIGWMLAFAPALLVVIAKVASIFILFIDYLIQSHKDGK